MCDKLVFDLSQEVEGSPNVFVRKDWINILDNQNQNYSNNQSIIDTSQLSNSNKYMSYRESYLSVPMLLTLKTTDFTALGGATNASGAGTGMPNPASQTTSFDYSIGLKNWFGQIIHSLTLDYNGTTILQQTPFANIWNCFKLMTSLSWQDVASQGATIGFYPDDPLSWVLFPTQAGDTVTAITPGTDFIGNGVCNNTNAIVDQSLVGLVSGLNPYKFGCGNKGLVKRQQNINFDNGAFLGTAGASSVATGEGGIVATGSAGANDIEALLITKTNTANLWKSHVLTKAGPMALTNNALTITTPAVYQVAIVATIYLKHIHSFFNMCPLLKGVFMKLTLNLNNASSTIVSSSTGTGIGSASALSSFIVTKTSVPIGGVNPMMIASPQFSLLTGSTSTTFAPNTFGTISATQIPAAATTVAGTSTASILFNGGYPLTTNTTPTTTAAGTFNTTYTANISVGARCLDTTLYGTASVAEGSLSKSIYLYVPAYTFNPVFEQAYLSTPIKQIKYTDIYQYQIQNIAASTGQINQLVTNGIANIKSVLIVPFFSPQPTTTVSHVKSGGTSLNSNTFLPQGMPVYQSPFDPAGCGCTSPLAHLTNFNVQISGQNAIYNMQKYGFEQFNNQLYGQNAVNGGLTDGLTSGLIDRLGFDMEYCFYYVNVERMLPVEQSVPKSVQILGQNISQRIMDYWVFVEYGVEISIDSLTGARV